MFKKFAAVGMTMALAGSILAGCGSSNTSNGANGGGTAASYVPKSLNVQFVPSQNDAAELQAKTKPLEKLLSDKLGIPVTVTVSTTYQTIIEAMASKQVDVGFIPATGYILAHDQRHAADLILQAQRFGVHQPDGAPTTELVSSYRAEILVRANSGIKTLQDLKGKKIAWQDPTSPAGYVWPAVEMKKAGVDPLTDVKGITVQGSGPAITALLNGEVDAAPVFEDARNIVKKDVPDVFQKLTPIYFTQPIPNDTICVRPDMDPAWKTKIQDAFIAIAQDNSPGGGHEIIKAIYTHEGYVKADDSAFDSARDYQKQLPQ
jgi:phosphonate transport system substrate-binding protein